MMAGQMVMYNNYPNQQRAFQAIQMIYVQLPNHHAALQRIEQLLTTDPPPNVSDALEKAAKAVPDLLRGNPAECSIAVMDVVAALSPLSGPEGKLISRVAALVSKAIAMMVGRADPFTAQLESVMRQFRHEQITDELSGTAGELRTAMHMLSVNPQAMDLNWLSRKEDTGLKFLYELANHMHREAARAKTPEELERLMEAVNAYCMLAAGREMFLHQLCTFYQDCNYFDKAQFIQNLNTYEVSRIRKDHLMFICVPPNPQLAAPAAYYTPDKYPLVARYLPHVNVFPKSPIINNRGIEVEQSAYSLWKTAGMMGLQALVGASVGPPLLFAYALCGPYFALQPLAKMILEHVDTNTQQQYVAIKNTETGSYLTRASNCADWIFEKYCKNEDLRRFKVVFTGDKKCLLSPKSDPGHFLYLENTDRPLTAYFGGKASLGDPGPQGYYNIQHL